MKKLIPLVFAAFASFSVCAQWHDMVWKIPYIWPIDNVWPLTVYDFNSSPLHINIEPDSLNDYGRHAVSHCISDSLGNPLFHTDGIGLIRNDHSRYLIQGVLSPAFPSITDPRMVLILPHTRTPGSYLIFHYRDTGIIHYESPKELVLTRLDSVFDGTQGTVAYLSRPVHPSGHLLYMAATKHANGRDWWLTTIEGTDGWHSSFDHLTFLVRGDSVALHSRQRVDNWPYGDRRFYAEPCFSPDGTKLCFFDRNDGFFVWDFDRCTGQLSNLRYDLFPEGYIVGHGAVAVSPNSRFAYIYENYWLMFLLC